MNRRQFIRGAGAIGLTLVTGCTASPAALLQAERVRHIGRVSGNASPDLVAAFRQELRGLGYVEGHNLSIEERSGGDDAHLAEPAAEITRLQPEVILVSSAA